MAWNVMFRLQREEKSYEENQRKFIFIIQHFEGYLILLKIILYQYKR